MEKLGAGDPMGVPPGVEHWGRIGAYRLLARLGAGGMGHVYLARSDRGRTVAVKLVRRELAAQEEFRERFRQEVRAAQQVGGHWTAPVLDADTEADVPWVATGYVAGPSLQQVVGHDHGALPERSVRILAAGLAHALKDIHAAGIVHRDLKPSNVLVTIDGPRVIDFGIARALETVTDAGLTRTGALIGSPGFMAPEQVRGDRITPACDVFCLGSVLAYAATGSLPFGGADSGVHALMFRIAQEEPDLDGVPEGIADLVRDCLKKDPGARPTLDAILERTGAEDTVMDGRSRDPWLPGALVAQLGRHAVGLLEVEDPEGPEPARAETGAGATPPPSPSPSPSPSPEHAAVADAAVPDASGAPAGPPAPGLPGTPVNHLPTMAAGQTPGPTPQPAGPPPHPAYGTPPSYGQPQQGYGGHAYGYPQPGAAPYGGQGQFYGGHTPAYGGRPPAPAYGLGPTLYGPQPSPLPPPPRRNGRATAALVAVALVVALAAGGSVYALMNAGGADAKAGGDDRTTSPVTHAPTTPADDPTPSPPEDGVIPEGYVGTWTASIDNADGSNTRVLTISQGEVGDPVLSLVADGPAGSGTYHCVFEAALTQDPGDSGPLEIGASTVTTGEPASSCSPGDPTRVTLEPDGTLRRVNTATGEELTYTRQ
ncbi:serine/threonine-protein kinase [Streptomyces sp. NPDC096205]|uniref:serine/threonine-protein kinase n=1 Tax=Streptomyces sp. NPDC096205 TaxID=3366081 RepID=UPI0037FE83B1